MDLESWESKSIRNICVMYTSKYEIIGMQVVNNIDKYIVKTSNAQAYKK